MIFSLRPTQLKALSSMVLLAMAVLAVARAERASMPEGNISKAASDSCVAKLKRLEKSSASAPGSSKQTIEFSESEINSYLAFELSKNYHASLKSLSITIEESKLRGVASIDFDSLAMSSKTVF